VVAGVCTVGDAGRGTWRGAELKASRGAGGMGKVRPRAARGAALVRTARRARRHGAGAVGSKIFHSTPVRTQKSPKN
jgi:hypothetical protein